MTDERGTSFVVHLPRNLRKRGHAVDARVGLAERRQLKAARLEPLREHASKHSAFADSACGGTGRGPRRRSRPSLRTAPSNASNALMSTRTRCANGWREAQHDLSTKTSRRSVQARSRAPRARTAERSARCELAACRRCCRLLFGAARPGDLDQRRARLPGVASQTHRNPPVVEQLIACSNPCIKLGKFNELPCRVPQHQPRNSAAKKRRTNSVV